MLTIVLVPTRIAARVSSKADINLSVVQVTIGSRRLVVLEQIVGIEELARLVDSSLLVCGVQTQSVEVADPVVTQKGSANVSTCKDMY